MSVNSVSLSSTLPTFSPTFVHKNKKKQEEKTASAAAVAFKSASEHAGSTLLYTRIPKQAKGDFKARALEIDLQHLRSISSLFKDLPEDPDESHLSQISHYFDAISTYDGGIIDRYTKGIKGINTWSLLRFCHICLERSAGKSSFSLGLIPRDFLKQLRSSAKIFEEIADYEVYRKKREDLIDIFKSLFFEEGKSHSKTRQALWQLREHMKSQGSEELDTNKAFSNDLTEILEFFTSLARKQDETFKKHVISKLENTDALEQKTSERKVFEGFYRYYSLQEAYSFTLEVSKCEENHHQESLEQWLTVLKEGAGEEICSYLTTVSKLRNYFEHPDEYGLQLTKEVSNGPTILYTHLKDLSKCLSPIMQRLLKETSERLKGIGNQTDTSLIDSLFILNEKEKSSLQTINDAIKNSAKVRKKPILSKQPKFTLDDLDDSQPISDEIKNDYEKLKTYEESLKKYRDQLLVYSKKFASNNDLNEITVILNDLEKQFNGAFFSKTSHKKLDAYKKQLDEYKQQLLKYPKDLKDFFTDYHVPFKRSMSLEELKEKLFNECASLDCLISHYTRNALAIKFVNDRLFNLQFRRKATKFHRYLEYVSKKLTEHSQHSMGEVGFDELAQSVRDYRNYFTHDLWRKDIKGMVDIAYRLRSQCSEFLYCLNGYIPIREGSLEDTTIKKVVQGKSFRVIKGRSQYVDTLPLSELKKALDKGLNLNARDSKGRTLLHFLAEHPSDENFEKAKYLIKKGANIYIPDFFNMHPFHYAAESGFEKLALFLIEHGAIVDLKSASGKASKIASRMENTQIAQHISKHEGEGRHAKAQALLNAIDCLDVEKIKKLILIDKVNPNIEFEERLPLVLLFTKEEANVKTRLEVAKLLLEAGAKIDQQESNSGEAALHAAAKYTDDSSVIELLMSYQPNINLRDSFGDAPLHIAVKSKREKWVFKLLEKKANVNLRGFSGYTPLLAACNTNQIPLSIVEALIDSGADVKSKTQFGGLSYYIKSRKGTDLLDLLIRKGALSQLARI